MNYAIYPTPVWTTHNRWSETASWKKNAIIRDKFRCVDCHNGSGKLIVHHIDETGKDEIQNNSLSNLVTLCSKCHVKRHGLNGSVKNRNVVKMLEEYSDENKNLIAGAVTIIGKKVGLTGERIRQMANSAGFITRNNKKNVFLYSKCVYCGKKFNRSKCRSRLCCSPSCHRNFIFYRYWTIVECKQCHLYFIVRRSLLENRGRYYCSKTCQGKYIGEHYGTGTKGNTRVSLKYKVEDLEKDLTNVFTTEEFARKYNYASKASASVAIAKLKFQNIVEPYRARGMFQIKQKSVVDKSL